MEWFTSAPAWIAEKADHLTGGGWWVVMTTVVMVGLVVGYLTHPRR